MMTRQQKLNKLSKKRPLIIHIVSPADKWGGGARAWGDTWVKWELTRNFVALGAKVSVSKPDVHPPDILIHLAGGVLEYVYGKKIYQYPNSIFKIIWLYSHPEQLLSLNLSHYDTVYCCSLFLLDKLRKMDIRNTHPMLGATSKIDLNLPKNCDILFLGNNRGPRGIHGRKIVNDLKSIAPLPYRISIWGLNWRGHVPSTWYGGNYWPYPKLNELYGSAKICLQDHRPEMNQNGIVSVKVFDMLASGGFVIADQNVGLNGIFRGAVPQYKSARHLKELIDYYITHPAEREALRRRGQEKAISCTWRSRAKLFLKEFGVE